MKIFMLFINTIYWLWLFIVPLLPIGGISIWLYTKSSENLPFIIILGVIGIISRFLLAESVRKKTGLSTFFGKILSTPDIKDNNLIESDERQDKN